MEPEGSLPQSQMPTTCPYPEPDRCSPCLPSNFLMIHLNIILPSMPGSSKCSLSSGFPTITLYMPLLSPISATFPACLILLDFVTLIIFSEQYRSLSSSLCTFLQFCYLVPLSPIYSPQHPILKHPQPTFLPQCERPRFTPIQNNRQNYSAIYLNFYIFG